MMLNVWWMVREGIKVGVEDAQKILAKYGFSSDTMPVPSDRAFVRRSVDEFHNRRGKDRRVVESVKNTAGYSVFGILALAVDGEAERGEYDQDTKVTLNRSTGSVEAEGVLAAEVLDRVQANRGHFNSLDVRKLCFRVIAACGGVSKRPTGGVYLIPSAYVDQIENLKLCLKELAGGLAAIYTERIYNGAEEKTIAAGSVYDDLVGRVEIVMKAVKGIGKRAGCLKKQKNNLAEIAMLSDVYRQVLGEQGALNDLSKILQNAEDQISEALIKLTNPITSQTELPLAEVPA